MQRFFHCDLHPQAKHIDARACNHTSDQISKLIALFPLILKHEFNNIFQQKKPAFAGFFYLFSTKYKNVLLKMEYRHPYRRSSVQGVKLVPGAVPVLRFDVVPMVLLHRRTHRPSVHRHPCLDGCRASAWCLP